MKLKINIFLFLLFSLNTFSQQNNNSRGFVSLFTSDAQISGVKKHLVEIINLINSNSLDDEEVDLIFNLIKDNYSFVLKKDCVINLIKESNNENQVLEKKIIASIFENCTGNIAD
jgi:hypothetical protein